MRLGFYYHIPVRKDGHRLLTAGYLGCFLESLAAHVEELVLLMHEAEPRDPHMDYFIGAANVRFVSLGKKPHAVVRTLLGGRLLRGVREELRACDVLLVRAPTHLLGALGILCGHVGIGLVPLLVGDRGATNASLGLPFPKRLLVQWLNSLVDARERMLLRGDLVCVNSGALADKYRAIASEVHEVRTTTLSESSFFERADTCSAPSIKVLYTGRFEWQKGLQELLDSFYALVREEGIDATLHLAGWQDSRGPSIEDSVLDQARVRGLSGRVVFHGRKMVGGELDALYRMADVYVMPSRTQGEGFPRTIWEAMANSLPVVATRVGAIPFYVEDGENAVLVEPGCPKQLLGGCLRLLNEPILRRRVIANGRTLARTNTLDAQAQKLVALLKHRAGAKMGSGDL